MFLLSSMVHRYTKVWVDLVRAQVVAVPMWSFWFVQALGEERLPQPMWQ